MFLYELQLMLPYSSSKSVAARHLPAFQNVTTEARKQEKYKVDKDAVWPSLFCQSYIFA